MKLILRAVVLAVTLPVALATGALSLAHSPALPAAHASGRVQSQSHPLDCIHWRILDNGGAGPLVRVLVCSNRPKDQGGDSPARDSTNWATLVVDGDAFATRGCGKSWTAGAGPCVVIGP